MQLVCSNHIYPDCYEKATKYHDNLFNYETNHSRTTKNPKIYSEPPDLIGIKKIRCIKYLRMLMKLIPSWAGYRNNYEVHFNTIMNATRPLELENYLINFSGSNFEKLKNLKHSESYDFEEFYYTIGNLVETLFKIQHLIAVNSTFRSIDRDFLKKLILQDLKNPNSISYTRRNDKWENQSAGKVFKTAGKVFSDSFSKNFLQQNQIMYDEVLTSEASHLSQPFSLVLPSQSLIQHPPQQSIFYDNKIDNCEEINRVSSYETIDLSCNPSNATSTPLMRSFSPVASKGEDSFNYVNENVPPTVLIDRNNIKQYPSKCANTLSISDQLEDKSCLTTFHEGYRTDDSTTSSQSPIVSYDINKTTTSPQAHQNKQTSREETSSEQTSPKYKEKGKSLLMEKLLIKIPQDYSTSNSEPSNSSQLNNQANTDKYQNQEGSQMSERDSPSETFSYVSPTADDTTQRQQDDELGETQVCTIKEEGSFSPIFSEDTETDINNLRSSTRKPCEELLEESNVIVYSKHNEDTLKKIDVRTLKEKITLLGNKRMGESSNSCNEVSDNCNRMISKYYQNRYDKSTNLRDTRKRKIFPNSISMNNNYNTSFELRSSYKARNPIQHQHLDLSEKQYNNLNSSNNHFHRNPIMEEFSNKYQNQGYFSQVDAQRGALLRKYRSPPDYCVNSVSADNKSFSSCRYNTFPNTIHQNYDSSSLRTDENDDDDGITFTSGKVRGGKWNATYRLGQKRFFKSFSVERFGYQEARMLAISQKQEWITQFYNSKPGHSYEYIEEKNKEA